MISTATIISKALSLLKEKGWVKGSYHDWMTDKYCAVGSIEQIITYEFGNSWTSNQEGVRLYHETLDLLREIASDRTSQAWASVESFNDDPSTGFDDVRDVFRSAIKKLSVSV